MKFIPPASLPIHINDEPMLCPQCGKNDWKVVRTDSAPEKGEFSQSFACANCLPKEELVPLKS